MSEAFLTSFIDTKMLGALSITFMMFELMFLALIAQ